MPSAPAMLRSELQRRVEHAALDLAQHRDADAGQARQLSPASAPARAAGGGSPRRAGAARARGRGPRRSPPRPGRPPRDRHRRRKARSFRQHRTAMLASRDTWPTSWSRVRPAASAARSSTPWWRAATACVALDRVASRPRRRARATWSTRPTPTPWRRRSPTRPRTAGPCATSSRSPAARCPARRPCADPAELPLDVFRASLEHNLVTRLDHAAGRAAAPAAQHGRPLDRADDVDRRARELRAAGLRGGEGGADRHSSTRSRRALGGRRHPHQRGRARRRADAAQRARVGARARLVRPAARGRPARPARHARRRRARVLALIELQHMTGQTLVVDGGQTLSRPAGDAREAAPAPQEEDR